MVDLRWGITDLAVAKNMTTSICLNEIRNCIKYSYGPCFIVGSISILNKMFIFIYRLLNIKSFLSHRYGQRMLPNEIELHKFQILKEECLKSCDLSFSLHLPNETSIEIENLLENCYNLDEN